MKATRLFLLICGALVTSQAFGRVFTDDQGRTVDAELVGVRGDNVVLSKNGRAAQWPISKLSAKDQLYVRAWQASPPETPNLSIQIWEREGIGASGAFDEPEEGGLPKNIPLLLETEEKANYKHYDLDITNRSQVDATNLTVAYVIYIVTASSQVEAVSSSSSVETIPMGQRVTAVTKGVNAMRTKQTITTINIGPFNQVSTGSDINRSKERFGGVWARVYSADGQVVGEAKKLIPEIERLDPAWTGPKEDAHLPLPISLDALNDILSKLPDLPEPPPGLPRPPGFPPKP